MTDDRDDREARQQRDERDRHDREAHDDRLAAETLATFDVPAPAADLGDRFLARLAAQPVRPARGRRVLVGLVAAGLVAAAIAIVVAWPTPAPAHGTTAARQRTTAALGDRGVAVVEPGGQLSWQLAADGAAHVDQQRGDVFYRVEHGALFVVSTPAGDVAVRGTCFRVELAGAATIVTVYEGAVELSNHAGRLALAAGDRGEATPDAAPHAPSPLPTSTPAELAGLRARDLRQGERIAALEARLAGTSDEALGMVQPVTRPFEMSQAELGTLARQCRVPFDLPPTAGSTVMDKVIDNGFRTADLDDTERAAVRRIIGRFQIGYQTALQALYRQLTGEDTALDPMTLILELSQKSTASDASATYQRIAAERAGLRAPAPDPKASVFERYVRFALTAGDDFERQLAAEIGASRARAFRRTWGMVNLEPGCPTTEGRP